MTTREEAIQAAALVLVRACAKRDSLSPRQAAEAAWYPGHRLGTIEAIEAKIISRRERAASAHKVERPKPLAA